MTEHRKDDSADRGRMPYVKPSVRCIKLAAEEVLAGGCKMDGAGSNFENVTPGCTSPTACINAGS